MFKCNQLNNAFSELYHPNGASGGGKKEEEKSAMPE